jgi:hypothetical protein
VGKKGNELLGDASDKIMVPTWQTVEGVFTTRYLLDILNAIPDTAIELHIKPKGGSLFKAPGREWRAVLMPVDPATLKDKVKAAAKPATQAPTPEPAVPVPAPVAPAEPAPSDAAPAAPKSDTLVADLRSRKNLIKAALDSKRVIIAKVP